MPELNINYYPFSEPQILTDVIYENYGGNLANSTEYQRQAAYWLAEEKASEDIGSFIAPARVTGTYHYSGRVQLEHGYVNQLFLTRFIDFKEDIYFTVSGTANVYVSVLDEKRGIVDVPTLVRNCACAYPAWNMVSPYKIQFVYETGIPSGTVYRSDILLGLSTYADIILNEIIGFGNEAPGDAGISEYSNQQYSEKRKGLINTTFGQSPRANFVHRLFTRLREYRWISL